MRLMSLPDLGLFKQEDTRRERVFTAALITINERPRTSPTVLQCRTSHSPRPPPETHRC
jgi:hypothetical protein